MKWWAIYTNLQVDVIVRVPHLGSGDSQGQETFLAPSAHKQTRNYDIECSNHHPSLSTLRQKELKARWNGEPYIQIYHWMSQSDYPIVGMERSRTRERFSTLCLQANPQLWHRVLKPPSLTINPQAKGIESKMKWWAIHTNLPLDVIVRLPHRRNGEIQNQGMF